MHGQHRGRIGGAPYWYCGSVPVDDDGALGVLWRWVVVDRLAVRALALAAAVVKAMPRTMAALSSTNFVGLNIVNTCGVTRWILAFRCSRISLSAK
jgi:hypothetical protein